MSRKTKIKFICHECNAEFEAFPTQKGRSPERFCSRNCVNKHRQVYSQTIICCVCSVEVIRTKKSQKTCGRECYYKLQLGRQGHKPTEEQRKNMSLAQKGRPKNFSKETRKRMAELKTGSNNPRWITDREAHKEKYRIRNIWRSWIHRTLLVTRQDKKGRSKDLLKYCYDELKSHLEKLFKPGMNWGNHGSGPGKWNIDHIKPISSFSSDTDICVVNALSNLQPSWYEDNMKKFDRE